MLEWLSGISGMLLFLIGFSFLVFVHELGHFVVARLVGIKCTQFAVGMGNALLSFRKGMGLRVGSSEKELERRVEAWLKAHESEVASLPEWAQRDRAMAAMGLGLTEYRLSSLPLGGYVKMVGQEDLDPTALSNDPAAYNRKPIWARMCVISAGVVMNLIFAFIFFVIAFTAGVDFPPAIVGDTVPGMPASQAYALGHEDAPAYRGLKPNDRITHVNGEATLDFTDIMIAAALGSPNRSVSLTVEREGEPLPLTYRVQPVPQRVDPSLPPLLTLGIEPPTSLTIPADLPDEAFTPQAQAGGVRPGMRVIAVADEPVTDFATYHDRLASARGRAVPVTFITEQGERHTAELSAVPDMGPDASGRVHLLGFRLAVRVAEVLPDSPADRAGLRAGDLLAQVNATPWPDMQQVQQMVRASQGPLRVEVVRGAERVALEPMSPQGSGDQARVGVVMGHATSPLRVGEALEEGPMAGVAPPGSILTHVNGQPVSAWSEVIGLLTSGEAARLTLALHLAGEPVREVAVAVTQQELERVAWLQPLTLSQLELPIRATGPMQAIALGFRKTHQTMLQTYITVMRLVQGSVKVGHLKGPVGIIEAGTIVTNRRGVPYLLFFLGLISVNLAVINFLPLPIVDGGHMVLLAIEKLKGSPVNAKIQAAVTYVGLVLIGMLFLVLTFNDIRGLVSNWF